jgi:hypothetical protein
MDLYEILLFVHITSVVIWVGGSIALQVVGSRFAAANDAVASAAYGQHTADVGTKIFMPASIAVLASGIWMVADASIPWEEPFVVYGIAAIVVSTVVGAAFLGPQAAKLATLVQEKGPAAPEVEVATKRFLTIARIDTVVLLSAIFVMTVKP